MRRPVVALVLLTLLHATAARAGSQALLEQAGFIAQAQRTASNHAAASGDDPRFAPLREPAAADRLPAALVREVDARLDPQYEAELAAWYASATWQRLAGLAARPQGNSEEVREQMRAAQTADDGDGRNAVIRRLVVAGRASELAAAHRQSTQALTTAVSEGIDLATARARTPLAADDPALRGLAEIAWSVTWRDAARSDLNEWVRFLEGPAGQALMQAVAEATPVALAGWLDAHVAPATSAAPAGAAPAGTTAPAPPAR